VASYHAEGVALLVRKYRGTGRVVTFFTRERGKVEAVAQGVGKPGSTLAPAVELFAHSDLLLAEGRDLDRLTQARVLEAFEKLRLDPRRLGYAGFICELLAKATEPGHPMPAAFEDLVGSLRLLDAGHEPPAVAAAASWRLLGELGVAPVLDHCVRCGTPISGEALYLPEEGGVLCSEDAGENQELAERGYVVRPQLRAATHTLAELPLERLPRVKLAPGVWTELLQVTRAQVRYYLGLDLNSDAFLRQLAPPGQRHGKTS